jgi:hypothetical protein
MALQGESRDRKLPGGRPLPRRLFSSDSTKSSIPSRESVVGLDTTASDSRRGHGRNESTTSTIREEGDPFANSATTTGAPFTPHSGRSIMSDFDFLPKSSVRPADAAPAKSSKFRLNRPPPISSSQSTSTIDSTLPSTPSKHRWEQLRSQVLPSQVPSSSSLPSFVPPSREGASTPTPSGRSTPTPKPSRLAARFGFKQVVETARSNLVSPEPPSAPVAPEPSAFEKELRVACWTARYGPEAPMVSSTGRSGHLREPTQGGMGSALWPLMSSNLAANASTLTLTSAAQGKAAAARSHASTVPRHPPSVAQLHSSLISHGSSSQGGSAAQHLPMEPELLAALLLPFFPQTGSALSNAEEERALAMEAFEVLSKTWAPASSEHELDRVLWICRAATLSLPTSYVRTHLVGTLYSALFPRARVFQGAGTPSHLRALVLGLLRLQATFVDPTSGRVDTESSEAQLLHDLFSQVTSPGFTDLDQSAVEAEYGTSYGRDEDPAVVRHEVICGAFLQSLGWFARRKQLWIVELIKVPLLCTMLPTIDPAIRIHGVYQDRTLRHCSKSSREGTRSCS